MKATARDLDWITIPASVRPFAKAGQTFVTAGRVYPVVGVSVYKAVSFYLVVDDLGMPQLIPSWCFNALPCPIPAGWVCTAGLGNGVELLLGPEFFASNLETYSAVVDCEPQAMNAVFKYLKQASGVE